MNYGVFKEKFFDRIVFCCENMNIFKLKFYSIYLKCKQYFWKLFYVTKNINTFDNLSHSLTNTSLFLNNPSVSL